MPPRKRKISQKRKKPEPDSGNANAASDEEEDEEMKAVRARPRREDGYHGMVSTFFSPPRAPSNRSLDDINLGGTNEADLRELIASLPERFPTEKAALHARFEAQFGRWWRQWQAGFSLLFYGYGSKRALLEKFVSECCGEDACLVIDGLALRLTARSILIQAAAVLKMVQPQQYRTTSTADLLQAITSEHPHRRLQIVLHNIDSPALREPSSQRLLSELAALPNIHFAASIDHVNAPLLWDLQTSDRFQWLWHHTATYVPYVDEVVAAAVPSLLVGNKEACTQQSALIVLSSLSNTAKDVFKLVVEAQLDQTGAGGISFQMLFAVCREKFIVSNEMLLRTFLTEFRDHDLLQSKRTSEGGDVFFVPLKEDELQQVLASMAVAGR